ncbi:MAG: alpha-amylase family glycosyl hydrolase, partial [Eubacteriales bacterium]|nr:alpha-amylase family glycosyl hydrolase [Eubacteriales bacterium]
FSIETNSRSALGTKSEFKAMCDEAEKYGIKVIVDTVFNHLANGNTENTLNSQIPSDIKDDSSSWHTYKTNISNYSDRYDITHNCLSGLPDLNTGYSKIQNYAIGFLKECIDCGADGFRFDAAKHIETPSDSSGVKSDFWPNVLNAATSYAESTYGFTPYYYGEMLDSTGGVDISAYTKYMSVTCNGSSNDIRNAVNSGNAGGAANSAIYNGAAPKNTVQWNESHDTYCEGSSSYVSDTNLKKTWALIGSRAEVCGLYLARPSSGSTKLGNADTTAWADKEVKAVNQFKNAFVGQSEYFASSGSIAYVERGTSGVVLVNVGGSSTSVSVTANRMSSGTYKDQISGNTFTVSNGKIKGNIGSTGIAVVYNADDIEVPTQTPTEVATSAPVSGETKTVYVGVVKYITDFVPTLHYWNINGVFGDVALSSTGKTADFAVGADYWSNEEKTFYIYEAQIPVEATNYKTYNATSSDCWAEEEVTHADNQITLVFEYSNLYHNFTAEYNPDEQPTQEPTVDDPTEEPTEEPTETPTETPTIEPTEPPTQGETTHPAGYYMVGKFNGAECWGADTLTEDRKLIANPDSQGEYYLNWTFYGGDELKVAYFDGYSITKIYKPDGEPTYKIGTNSDKVGYGKLSFNPDGNSDWSYNYFTVKKVSTVEPTIEPTDEPTEETEKPTESETVAPTQSSTLKVNNIKVEPAASTAVFTWDAIDGATKYWVYKYNESKDSWSVYTSTTGTRVVAGGLTGETTYQFKIVATLANGSMQKLSNADVIEFTTLEPVVVDTLVATPSTTSAVLSWEAVEGAQKYWIYKAFEENGPFYVYDATTELNYTVKRLQAETTYYFKVVPAILSNGMLALGEADACPDIAVTTTAGDVITTVITDVTSTTATISWPAYENAVKYWVIYSTTTKSTSDLSKWSTWSSTTDTTYTFKWREPGKYYFFSVVAL